VTKKAQLAGDHVADEVLSLQEVIGPAAEHNRAQLWTS
jgi:hypothetical protein